MNSKQIVILTLAIGCVAVVNAGYRQTYGRAVDARQLNPEAPVTEGVRNNFISILTRVANASEIAGTNVSRAAALLVRGVVREGFNLGSVATYLPRLLFLDGPNQFIETLRLIRSNQLRLPNDMDSAIDTLITFTGSVRDSGITGNFSPVVEFFPNIFTGVEKFVQDLLYNVFSWLAPIPPAASLDQAIKGQAVRIVPTTFAPV
ncbi:uncharacterized protein LOC110859873 [Folsomia candida]|uniref:Uncharacterized protein n=1 Tax=Folsomia candida TaxID=158441 RepID=A0A226DAZ6_FOLCA|nr:uncharacterized protein LOC110859873 [Folsomia candida]OXA41791.1 hypothetical protein Fcan01_23587 [Folsomia candida]